MLKFLPRIVAFLLVPCLVVDPAMASGLNSWTIRPAPESTTPVCADFSNQAVTAYLFSQPTISRPLSHGKAGLGRQWRLSKTQILQKPQEAGFTSLRFMGGALIVGGIGIIVGSHVISGLVLAAIGIFTIYIDGRWHSRDPNQLILREYGYDVGARRKLPTPIQHAIDRFGVQAILEVAQKIGMGQAPGVLIGLGLVRDEITPDDLSYKDTALKAYSAYGKWSDTVPGGEHGRFYRRIGDMGVLPAINKSSLLDRPATARWKQQPNPWFENHHGLVKGAVLSLDEFKNSIRAILPYPVDLLSVEIHGGSLNFLGMKDLSQLDSLESALKASAATNITIIDVQPGSMGLPLAIWIRTNPGISETTSRTSEDVTPIIAGSHVIDTPAPVIGKGREPTMPQTDLTITIQGKSISIPLSEPRHLGDILDELPSLISIQMPLVPRVKVNGRRTSDLKRAILPGQTIEVESGDSGLTMAQVREILRKIEADRSVTTFYTVREQNVHFVSSNWPYQQRSAEGDLGFLLLGDVIDAPKIGADRSNIRVNLSVAPASEAVREKHGYKGQPESKTRLITLTIYSSQETTDSPIDESKIKGIKSDTLRRLAIVYMKRGGVQVQASSHAGSERISISPQPVGVAEHRPGSQSEALTISQEGDDISIHYSKDRENRRDIVEQSMEFHAQQSHLDTWWGFWGSTALETRPSFDYKGSNPFRWFAFDAKGDLVVIVNQRFFEAYTAHLRGQRDDRLRAALPAHIVSETDIDTLARLDIVRASASTSLEPLPKGMESGASSAELSTANNDQLSSDIGQYPEVRLLLQQAANIRRLPIEIVLARALNSISAKRKRDWAARAKQGDWRIVEEIVAWARNELAEAQADMAARQARTRPPEATAAKGEPPSSLKTDRDTESGIPVENIQAVVTPFVGTNRYVVLNLQKNGITETVVAKLSSIEESFGSWSIGFAETRHDLAERALERKIAETAQLLNQPIETIRSLFTNAIGELRIYRGPTRGITVGKHAYRLLSIYEYQDSNDGGHGRRSIVMGMATAGAAIFVPGLRGAESESSGAVSKRDMEFVRDSVHLYSKEFAPPELNESVITDRIRAPAPHWQVLAGAIARTTALTIGLGVMAAAFVLGIVRSNRESSPDLSRRTFARWLWISVSGLYMSIWAEHLRISSDRIPQSNGLFDAQEKFFMVSRKNSPNDTIFRWIVDHELAHLFGRHGLHIFRQELPYANAFPLLQVLEREGSEGLERVFAWSKDTAPKQFSMTWKQAYELGQASYRDPTLDPNQRLKKIVTEIMQHFPGEAFDANIAGDHGREWLYLYGIAVGAIAEQISIAHGSKGQPNWHTGRRYLWAMTAGIQEADNLAVEAERFAPSDMEIPTTKFSAKALEKLLQPQVDWFAPVADVLRGLLAMSVALGLTWGAQKITRRRMTAINRWTWVAALAGAFVGSYHGYSVPDQVLFTAIGAITLAAVVRLIAKIKRKPSSTSLSALLIMGITLFLGQVSVARAQARLDIGNFPRMGAQSA